MTDEMHDEVEIISDGDGIAVVGDSAAVDRFAAALGVPSRVLDLRRLAPMLSKGSGFVQAGSEVSANAGRWMKLTEESARAARQLPLVQRSPGLVQATTRGPNGQFVKNLQFLAKPGALLTNPAILAGAAGIMAQYAMQQTMEEITEYLAKIDAKVDDVLQAQEDTVFADMLGVELMVEEALAVRAHVGRVSEVTWSKIQGSAATIARTQGYALRQLEGLAQKVERTAKVSELAEIADDAQEPVGEWLAVLARCFQLQDAAAILELDRVLAAAPDDLDQHRIGLQAARTRRRDLIGEAAAHLAARMDAAASRANARVLLNPVAARSVVRGRNHVATNVGDLRKAIGIADDSTQIDARRWSEAAVDVRDDVLDAGAAGLQTAGQFGADVLEGARMSAGRFAGRLAKRLQRTDEAETRHDSGADDPGAPER